MPEDKNNNWYDDLDSLAQNGIISINHVDKIKEEDKYKSKYKDKPKSKNLIFKIKIGQLFSTIQKTIILYLSIAGFVTFSLFILEESLQTAMFSTWAAKDAQDWALVMKANRFFENTNAAMGNINKYFGWVNPFSYKAYNAYHDATQFVINANDAQIANFEPMLFVGFNDNIFLHIKITQILRQDSGIVLVSGRFMIEFNNNMYMPSPGETVEFYGRVTNKTDQSNQRFVLEPVYINKLNFNK